MLEESTRKILENMGIDNAFLNRTPIIKEIRKKLTNEIASN
jgi:hypothetical protein